MYRDGVHSDQHSHAHSSKIFIMVTIEISIAPNISSKQYIIKTDTKTKNNGNCYCD